MQLAAFRKGAPRAPSEAEALAYAAAVAALNTRVAAARLVGHIHLWLELPREPEVQLRLASELRERGWVLVPGLDRFGRQLWARLGATEEEVAASLRRTVE